jgi:hypothetical protein
VIKNQVPDLISAAGSSESPLWFGSTEALWAGFADARKWLLTAQSVSYASLQMVWTSVSVCGWCTPGI